LYLTIRGLVLRITPYKDHDALLTLLTADQGKLTVKARGLRRKNNPMVATCQLLAYGEFTVFEYRGMHTINEAQSIELFQRLRNDLTKLSLATYFAQVADVLSQEDTPDSALLNLVLNSLYALCNLSIPEEQIKAVFELRAACLAGYTPDLQGCSMCGNPLPDLVDLSQGHLECSHCRNADTSGIRMPLTPGVLDSMRFVCSCEPQRLFSFRIGEETAARLSQISEAYLTTQLERSFSTLDFYKSLFICS